MSTTEDRHSPTPEFVGRLEQELLRVYRTEGALAGAAALRPRWHERLRVAAMIAVGVAFGVGAQLASAQVRESKQAVEVSRAIEVERELAAYRLELAKLEVDRLRTARASGAVPEQALREALLAQREAEITLARRSLDIAEVRASKAPPRDELWAPLVERRDFVRERLLATAALTEERLKSAEVEAATVERNVKAGVEQVGALKEAQARVADTEGELRLLAMKSKLREKVLEQKLEPVEVTRQVLQAKLEVDLARAQRLLELAQERGATVAEQRKAGLTSLYEEKRAELEIMEREAEVRRMTLQLKRGPIPEER